MYVGKYIPRARRRACVHAHAYTRAGTCAQERARGCTHTTAGGVVRVRVLVFDPHPTPRGLTCAHHHWEWWCPGFDLWSELGSLRIRAAQSPRSPIAGETGIVRAVHMP